jgi:hypothetical protein
MLLFTGVLCAMPEAVTDSSSPIGLSLFPPLQLPNSEFGITGIRMGLVSVNRSPIINAAF